MSRGGEENTFGMRLESGLRDVVTFAGLGLGSAGAFSIPGLESSQGLNSPEELAVAAGAVGSILAGGAAGLKLSDSMEGRLAGRIDNAVPDRFKEGKIYLDSDDPFGIEVSSEEFEVLDQDKIDLIENFTGVSDPDIVDLYDLERMSDDVDGWVEELVYGEINGFQRDYRTNFSLRGDFKAGYVDREEEFFVQAPCKGNTFESALKRVQTWKENKQTLDHADVYLDQVLSHDGEEYVPQDYTEIEIDYDFLNENEELLREEVEGGILTPSENYDIVVTSHEGDPLPVLVGEFNDSMVEASIDFDSLENSEEVEHRKKVLGMYMDALNQENLFQGYLADFWYSEGLGREHTKNMFYDPETDSVGVTDIGEYRGTDPEEMPDISIESRYRREFL